MDYSGRSGGKPAKRADAPEQTMNPVRELKISLFLLLLLLSLGTAGYMVIEGWRDETLLRAGSKRAKGFVSVVTPDTENVYITLTAHGPGDPAAERGGLHRDRHGV